MVMQLWRRRIRQTQDENGPRLEIRESPVTARSAGVVWRFVFAIEMAGLVVVVVVVVVVHLRTSRENSDFDGGEGALEQE